ncbi:phosphoribulokinase [Corticicoccus populi]|uniref:Phosphoribulokinase n=1 Tax=Corticicoccus populi TaxID=1812821 RepID=A0ABW5WZK6_9STAP
MKKLVENMIRFIEVSKEKHLIIGISGHGAAGKTMFAERLCSALEPGTYNYLNTDPYIIHGTYRKHLEAVYEYNGQIHRFKPTACMPSAHELSGLERDLKSIKGGRDVLTIHKEWMPEEVMSAGYSVTVVEGMSIAFLDPALFDCSVYIYTDGETELNRRLDRDINDRGRKTEALYQSHEERRIQYELFMHPESVHFDILVNHSNDQFKIERTCF